METILKIVVAVAALMFSLVCAPVKQYQLAYYRLCETFAALRRRKAEAIVLPSVVSCLAAAVATRAAAVGFYPYFVGVACGAAVTLSVVLPRLGLKKSKVVKTARLSRFLNTYASFCVAACVSVYFLPALCSLPAAISAAAFTLAHAVCTPIENARNARFIRSAKAKLDRINPIRIGVTGSYGKTTFKNILAAMLGEKYRVCVTRGNFNTPLGIARTIAENMTDDAEVFIAEAGARYVGDISVLADIIRPDYAVVTALGTQHLETFGSPNNLKNEKYELVRALVKPENAFFGASAAELYKRAGKGCAVGANVFVSDVKRDGGITRFTARIEKTELALSVPLAGDFIPDSVALAAAVALRLGVSADAIKKSAARLNSVAHRQQLLYNGLDVIIDDAYNANEAGARSALRLLSGFSGKTRVFVTPGIVELGVRQYDANYELGAYSATRCDVAIFIGSNARALTLGAESGGKKSRVYEVGSLAAATELLKTIKGERAILFENDLPDNYR